jgi:hypothetical protein
MYRYTVDNAVTYTSEDLVLFRESPFACWMERLTLENAGHGIAPDPGSTAPNHGALRQDDMAETLRAEGKDVLLVDWEEDESRRRAATLKGMREGADFIVNGQLALGPLSDSANLLMRTSGYSDLGDYLYIPCETQGTATRCAAFRLCFLADLLHSLQGQLPPQMLIIRGGDIVPLQTEDHIYHYRAVKHRFMQAMREFRKHRMPDPAESSHFGRWSVCANELLRQRAEKREPVWQEGVEEAAAEESPPVQQQRFAQVAPAAVGYSRSGEITRRALNTGAPPGAAVLSPGGQVPSGPTLVEQARRLAPAVPGPRGSGSTDRPTLAAAVTAEVPAALTAEEAADADRGGHRPVSDPALENLEFIGNRARQPASPALSPADPVDAEARLPTGGAIDRDEPSFIEPLPLPEVEEISLDGSLLPPEWVEAPWGEPGAATATLPDDGPRPRRPDGEAEAWRVAPADAERGEAPSTAEGARPGRAAPSPSLNPAGQWQREGAAARSPGDAGSAGSAGSSRGRDFAPRDFAPREFVPAAGLYSSVDPDSGTIASPPAGLVTSGDTAQKAPRKEGSRPLPSRGYPPREDADAPAAYPAFSDTLITSDSYDD